MRKRMHKNKYHEQPHILLRATAQLPVSLPSSLNQAAGTMVTYKRESNQVARLATKIMPPRKSSGTSTHLYERKFVSWKAQERFKNKSLKKPVMERGIKEVMKEDTLGESGSNGSDDSDEEDTTNVGVATELQSPSVWENPLAAH
ncbi:hypothetical protein K7X08_017257 [Anisodus acutangulus]|uniref:Uncharacterized protein n=1 Tax=Anisodus acutangulus TaxID=402998 RepID=A0A9Q1LUS5_9SOLA|nr:hypothetical protein K7X08_017257 [Anisodus acutangulus]